MTAPLPAAWKLPRPINRVFIQVRNRRFTADEFEGFGKGRVAMQSCTKLLPFAEAMNTENKFARRALELMRVKAFIRGNPDNSPMREVHRRGSRKPIGRYPSRKIRRSLTWESVHEREMMWLSEADPAVVAYYDQPHEVTLDLQDYPKPLKYFPDILRIFAGGGREVIEVKKTQAEINAEKDLDYARKIQLAEMAYRAAGYQFRVVTAQDDIKIEPVFSNAKAIQRCRFTATDTLDRLKFHEHLGKTGGATTLGGAIRAVSDSHDPFDPVATAKVYALIVQREAWIDIRKRLDLNSQITIVDDSIRI
ncbi:hypothetical protein HUU61_04075 [Rhodopseudomonas palustris]|nr:hypothetical protein [Rhodopseudomonas palustris]